MLGLFSSRYQMVFDKKGLPARLGTTGLFLRSDDQVTFNSGGFKAKVHLRIGAAKNAPSSLAAKFADNLGKHETFFRGTVDLPILQGGNKVPLAFGASIPLTKPWLWDQKDGHPIFDLTLEEATGRWFYLDVAANKAGLHGAVFNGQDHTAISGAALTGWAPVLGLRAPAGIGILVDPRFSSTDLPEIGVPYKLKLEQALPSAIAIHVVGFSETQWGTIKLPLDLSGAGAPGCSLLASFDLPFALTLDKEGMAETSFQVPNDKAFIRGSLVHQILVLDAKANGLGIVTSSALRALLGGQP
jgi:hypothetical protein